MARQYPKGETERLFSELQCRIGDSCELTLEGRYVTVECRLHGAVRKRLISCVGCPVCVVQAARRENRVDIFDSRHVKFVELLAIKSPCVKVVGYYSSEEIKIRLQCPCGRRWNCSKSRATRTRELTCPKCSFERMGEDQKVTREAFVRRLTKKHGTRIQLVGAFKPGLKSCGRFRCNECHVSFEKQFMQILKQMRPCPSCASERRAEVARSLPKTGRFKLKNVEIAGKKFVVQGYEPQGIEWLLRKEPKLRAKDIVTDHEGGVPTFRYKIGRRTRTYFPDIYIKKANLIVEIKSRFTLGLESGKGWRKNQQKAKAVLAEGYKFIMLVMGEKGHRLCRMPENWHSMSRDKVLIYLAYARGAGDDILRGGKYGHKSQIRPFIHEG